jgi:hypothetical protein
MGTLENMVVSVDFAKGPTRSSALRVERFPDGSPTMPECSALANLIARRFVLRPTPPPIVSLMTWANEDRVYLQTTMRVRPRDDTGEELPEYVHVEPDGYFEIGVRSYFAWAEFAAEGPASVQEYIASVEFGRVDPLARFFRNAVLDAVEHEIDECIFDGDTRRFDPHLHAANGAGVRMPPFRNRNAEMKGRP